MDDNRVVYTHAESAYLFKVLDHDHDGRISFADFQKSTLPKTDAGLRAAAVARAPYDIDVGMLLPAEVETSLARLFDTII